MINLLAASYFACWHSLERFFDQLEPENIAGADLAP
jgi:hypothetical protein